MKTSRILINFFFLAFFYFIANAFSLTFEVKNNLKGKITHIETKIYKVKENGEKQLNSIAEYFYQEDNRLIQTKLSNANNNFSYKDTSIYDNKGSLIEGRTLVGRDTDQTIYEYDSKNRVIKMKNYNSSGELTKIATYIYSDDEQFYEVSYEDGKGKSLGKYTFKSNEKGQIEVEEYYWNGSLNHLVRYSYNKYGDVIEESTTDGQEEISKTSYEYKYDKKSNWIERTNIHSDLANEYYTQSDTHYKRTITYAK